MSRANLRTAIIILTVITAFVHLVILNILFMRAMGFIDITFTLNGVGYLALLAALFYKIPFLADKQKWVHYFFMSYTIATILAYFMAGDGFSNPLGIFTKVVELLLVVVLWMHFQTTVLGQAPQAASEPEPEETPEAE